ncbi:archaetidylserine decarboxylase [Sphingosinicella rhizophila]|uniref:phosphatidylserine decarboxylase n=1 Tax=Sphingosinicella rhizophila TaxID=3050082 RepID=A0ABU3Q7B5_9SPHN|nr:archaetidylserine decarboxylase [Sphingosinicella sp. GR2756]MDT9599302.1 archaetidylserine decarboxylase [Sphingosinicella sp. GR2756]
MRHAISKILLQEDINFLLTNRLPRRAATRFMGWFSKIEQPLIRTASIALWRFFADVDLSDAASSRFKSLHDGFTRALKEGARIFDPDPDILASPCDAIVGACGRIREGRLYQAKGFPYALTDLLGDDEDASLFEGGQYATLRLTAGMYHRFHAPHDLTVEQVVYRSGDTWNVNPIALKRVENLFCKNERASIRARLDRHGHSIMLVPVAAILVASIRLHFLDASRSIRAGGPRRIACAARIAKGEEMGWFEHGSTILLFAPPGFALCQDIEEGCRIRAGQKLMRLPGVRTLIRHR